MASRPPQPQQRPPQAMAAMPRPRILRVGIILGGKIVEEKLIRDRETISIGQSVRNTFSVPTEGMPRNWPLFLVKDGNYYLHFSDAMDGRVSDGNTVHPLPALKGNGALRSGEGWILPLPETARGKIVLGEMTLLFQFVTAPPLQPRPHLPASVRGGLMDRLDPLLLVIMGLSMSFHIFVMVFFGHCYEPEEGGSVERIYDEVFTEERVATMDVQEPKVTEGETGTKPQEAKEPAKEPSKKPAAGGHPDKTGGNNAKPGPTQEELEEQMALEVEKMLSEGEGAEQGGMRDRDPGTSINEEAKEVEEGGVKVSMSTGGDDRGPRRGDNKRATGTGPNVNTGTGTENTGGNGPVKVAKVPDVNIKKEDMSGDVKAGTPEAILAKIRSQYVHGLKQCFKKVLLTDENASGTVRLKFTVSERGNTTNVAIKGFGYPDLDSCVQAKVGNWVFNAPKDPDGEPTTLDVKLSLPFTGR